MLAYSTGGKFYYHLNDLDRCMENAALDSADYYMLGYYATQQPRMRRTNTQTANNVPVGAATVPNWHNLQVKIDVPGLDVSARSGYYSGDYYQPGSSDPLTSASVEPPISAEPPIKEKNKKKNLPTFGPAQEAAEDEALALTAPVNYTAIQIFGRWKQITSAKNGQKRIGYELIIPPGFLTVDTDNQDRIRLDFIAVAKNAKGKIMGESAQHVSYRVLPGGMNQFRNAPLPYQNALEVAPGEYTVTFVVRDNVGGRTGSVSTPLKVE